jgi:hypothetical protein
MCGYNFVLDDELYPHITEVKKGLKYYLILARSVITLAKHTHAIERDNSNTRHHLTRMTRRTKVVSKSIDMIRASLKLWYALNVPAIFEAYQALFLSIFK